MPPTHEAAIWVDGSTSKLVLPAVIMYRGKPYALAETVRGGLRIESGVAPVGLNLPT